MDGTNSSNGGIDIEVHWQFDRHWLDPKWPLNRPPFPKWTPADAIKKIIHLIHTPDNGSHGGISRSIDSSTVIGWTPNDPSMDPQQTPFPKWTP